MEVGNRMDPAQALEVLIGELGLKPARYMTAVESHKLHLQELHVLFDSSLGEDELWSLCCATHEEDMRDVHAELLRIARLNDAAGALRFVRILVSLGQEFLLKDYSTLQETIVPVVLSAMPYNHYLKTDHWKRLAAYMKRSVGERCQLCNAAGELHAHHRTYERRGREIDNDLTVLCAECHAKFHDKLPAEPEPTTEIPVGDPGIDAGAF
jgi:hypothetical protein